MNKKYLVFLVGIFTLVVTLLQSPFIGTAHAAKKAKPAAAKEAPKATPAQEAVKTEVEKQLLTPDVIVVLYFMYPTDPTPSHKTMGTKLDELHKAHPNVIVVPVNASVASNDLVDKYSPFEQNEFPFIAIYKNQQPYGGFGSDDTDTAIATLTNMSQGHFPPPLICGDVIGFRNFQKSLDPQNNDEAVMASLHATSALLGKFDTMLARSSGGNVRDRSALQNALLKQPFGDSNVTIRGFAENPFRFEIQLQKSVDVKETKASCTDPKPTTPADAKSCHNILQVAYETVESAIKAMNDKMPPGVPDECIPPPAPPVAAVPAQGPAVRP